MKPRVLLLAAAVLLESGCASILNKAVKRRTIPMLSQSRDLQMACSFGQVAVGLSNTVSGQRSEQALAVAWTMAGLCAEMDAREQALQSQLALVQLPVQARAAAATDARLAANRRYDLAASRFQRAYQLAIDAYGGADTCKLHSEADQGVYILGLMAGLLAQVDDGQAGGTVGVPLNQILEVARATACLDDARWWGIPSAARYAAWATVPGSGPTDVDPWAGLADAAARGDALGQGLPRALWLFSAANAGKVDLVHEILQNWPSPEAKPRSSEPDNWPLLDAYARVIARHEADLLWIAAKGHRAPAPPTPPTPPPLIQAAPADPFGGADPFGDDSE